MKLHVLARIDAGAKLADSKIVKTAAGHQGLRTVITAALIGFIVTSWIISCDGPGWAGAGIEYQSPAGIFSGFFQSTATSRAETRTVTAIVSEDLAIHVMVQPTIRFSQFGGVVSVDGDVLTGTMTEYLGARARWFGFDGVRSVMLEGTVSERKRLFGDYTGDDTGVFSLDYSEKYDRESELDQVSGVWTFDLGTSGGGIYTISLGIGISGQLFGTDTNGCAYNGRISIIDGRFNAYSASVTVSLCQPVEGDYTGLAFRGDSQGETLWLFLDNGRYAFSTMLSQ